MLVSMADFCKRHPELCANRQTLRDWRDRYREFPKVRGRKQTYGKFADVYDEEELLAWVNALLRMSKRERKVGTIDEAEKTSFLDNDMALVFICGGRRPTITAGVAKLDWGKE